MPRAVSLVARARAPSRAEDLADVLELAQARGEGAGGAEPGVSARKGGGNTSEVNSALSSLAGSSEVGGCRGAEPPGLVTTTLSESRPSRGGGEAPSPGGARPAATRLRYVEACAMKAWSLRVWKRAEAETPLGASPVAVRYVCRSWRHAGDCRRWRAAQNFARVTAALEGCSPRHIVYVVFTFRQGEGAKWETRYDAFRGMVESWRSLRKAIARRWGKPEYVSVCEVHRSGWPHLNVIMVCPRLAAELATPPVAPGTLRELKRHAVACGWGFMLTAEVARDASAVAGYAVKLAGDVEQRADAGADGRLVGEVVKFSQVPENAPRHFRRLRSSYRFLPPPFKGSGEWTGELVKRPADELSREMVPRNLGPSRVEADGRGAEAPGQLVEPRQRATPASPAADRDRPGRMSKTFLEVRNG